MIRGIDYRTNGHMQFHDIPTRLKMCNVAHWVELLTCGLLMRSQSGGVPVETVRAEPHSCSSDPALTVSTGMMTA